MGKDQIAMPVSVFDLLLLDEFRRRPAMYIRQVSISILEAFIIGYLYAVEVNKLEVKEVAKFDSFNDWVAEYYDLKASTAGWKNNILTHCKGDEKAAFYEFLKLYDAFWE